MNKAIPYLFLALCLYGGYRYGGFAWGLATGIWAANALFDLILWARRA